MEEMKLLKTLLLSVLLVEAFDDIETGQDYRHEFKQKGNQFKAVAEKYCNKVFDNSADVILDTQFVSDLSDKLEKIILQEIKSSDHG